MVLFPDGCDGRAFTLKAETSEDMLEWKITLEQALAQAPSVALVMGHNGIYPSKNQISSTTVNALREATSRGVKIVIATGKAHPAVIDIFKMVDLTRKDGIVSEFSPGVFLQRVTDSTTLIGKTVLVGYGAELSCPTTALQGKLVDV
ncbi:hypothetical protein JHK87_022563 [Glycine soja]|nr:hypothetical protein JHK87_022563 [Glycine soja]